MPIIHPYDAAVHRTPATPNYIVLNDNRVSRRPPTYPLGHNAHRDNASWFGGSRFLKCMCWCYCVLFVIILLLGGLLFYAYTFYKPKLSSYEMLDFEVIAFNAQPDFSLYTEFQVTVWTENPNLFIGLTYEEGSTVSILFGHLPLCFGKLLNIHQGYNNQGHNNVTMINVVLKGKSTFGSGLYRALTGGKIPLVLSVRAPVVIMPADKFPLRQFTAKVNCTMVVNNLKPGKKPSILSTDYSYGFEL